MGTGGRELRSITIKESINEQIKEIQRKRKMTYI